LVPDAMRQRRTALRLLWTVGDSPGRFQNCDKPFDPPQEALIL